MRIKHRINHRVIALLLALATLFGSMGALSLFLQRASAEFEPDLHDALHFIIRHWHTYEDDQAKELNPDQSSSADDFYFVVVEGYIVPDGNTYDCYLVNQETKKLVNNAVEKSTYVNDFNEDDGIVDLNIKPLIDPDSPNEDSLEVLTGVSISAGHDAVEYDDDSITVEYDPYVHLVKGHVFYRHTSKIVTGTNDTVAFANTGMFDESGEIDTAWVYTYLAGVDGHAEGEIVKSESDENLVCIDKDDLPEGCIDVAEDPENGNVKLTKYYSTAEGLHTDNSVGAMEEDGRTFRVDLEAWYTEGYAAQVGMVLDASGSMAFAIDVPAPIHLSDDELENLGISKVLAGKTSFSSSDFLTDAQVNKILNPRNTDNSTLSVSGYSYYVYSIDDSNGNNYSPLAYWEGVASALLTFTDDRSGKLPTIPDQASPTINLRSWLYDSITGGHAKRVSPQVNLSGSYAFAVKDDIENWPGGDLKFSSNGGLQVAREQNLAGVLLDAAPSGGDFTLSFDLKLSTTGSGLIEMLYIGPMSSESKSGYFRLYYDMSTKKLYGSQTSGTANTLTSDSTITTANSQTVTLVFKNADTGNGTVTMYIGGKESGSGELTTPITEANIILAGVQDSYSGGADDLDIDNLALYDNYAATADQVKMLNSRYPDFNATSTPTTVKTRKNTVIGTFNPVNASSAKTKAGWYFVSHAGSYSNFYAKEGILTAKRLWGVASNETGTDEVNYIPDGITSPADTYATYTAGDNDSTLFYVDADGYLRCFYSSTDTKTDKKPVIINCSYVYKLADEQYVRTEALQRVLGNFTTALYDKSPASQVSAVRYSYNLDANGETHDTSKLILMDWTNDPKEMAGFLSLNRGDGTSLGSDPSSYGNAQYNYGLTGGTYTRYGLEAYRTYLQINDYKSKDQNKDAPRYLIIFTDGYDSETNHKEAYNNANALKEDGYTIFSVLLGDRSNEINTFLSAVAGKDGVKVNPTTGKGDDDNRYYFWASDIDELADAFLSDILAQIVDPLEDYTVTQYVDPRFDLKNADGTIWHLHSHGEVLWQPAGVSLEEAKKNPDNYQYLIDKDGNAQPVLFRLSGETIPRARTPMLYYDKEEDMYYLEWVEQTIPTSGVGAPELEVWYAELWLTAKEDFIGGNDILTNGNAEKMNWVHHPYDSVDKADQDEYKAKLETRFAKEFDNLSDSKRKTFASEQNFDKKWEDMDETDMERLKELYITHNVALTLNASGKDASSGTDDAKKTFKDNTAVDAYPSKGFPRTVVNVRLLPIETLPLNDVIFKGEFISHAQILTAIEDEYVTDTYYLEYLRRYAYQRYLYVFNHKKEAEDENPVDTAKVAMFAALEEETEEDLNKPLIELLNDWLGIKDDNRLEKAFSIPYMYLPSVEHNDDGTIKLNPDGLADILTNCGGADTHQKDVIGILTYRWNQIEPGEVGDEIKNYVKEDTERNKYSLTVEFTPLKKGDTLKDKHYLSPSGDSYYHDEEKGEWYTYTDGKKTTLDQAPSQEILDSCTLYAPLRSYIDITGRTHIFAHYLPIEGIDGDKSDFTKENDDFEGLGFNFDRAEGYVNGNLITDEVYKWNSDHKPARNEGPYHAGDLQPVVDPNDESGDESGGIVPYSGLYGTAEHQNKGRTLTAMSAYTQTVVGGDFVLEIKALIGELLGQCNDGKFKKEFKVKATRSFTDTDFAEELKSNGEYADYGREADKNGEYTFTFEFDYTADEIKKLLRDDDGYVRIFAKLTEVKHVSDDVLVPIDEMPIGTYVFNRNSVTSNTNLHFAEIEDESEPAQVQAAYPYFNDAVKRGLSSINEKGEIKYDMYTLTNWAFLTRATTLPVKTTLPAEMTLLPETLLPAGTSMPDGTLLAEDVVLDHSVTMEAGAELLPGTVLPVWTFVPAGTVLPVYGSPNEITSANIDGYMAEAFTSSDKQAVTFYVGTGSDSHRGNLGENPQDPTRYTNDRTCIIRLSTGTTRLTIQEKGALPNESFIYYITGTTLGYQEVDLYVSVKGNSFVTDKGTTIEILPGTYTVKEIPDWSWKYTNKAIYGKYGKDDGALDEKWTIRVNQLEAETSLWYYQDNPVNEHKTVIYEHARNEKVWLGGENSKDNNFSEVQ